MELRDPHLNGAQEPPAIVTSGPTAFEIDPGPVADADPFKFALADFELDPSEIETANPDAK